MMTLLTLLEGNLTYIYIYIYYHLGLYQVPHLLNFAVPWLPTSTFHEHTDSAKSSSLSKIVGTKKAKYSFPSSYHSSSTMQMANALKCFEQVNAAKLKVLQSSAAPRCKKRSLIFWFFVKVVLRLLGRNWKSWKIVRSLWSFCTESYRLI